MDRTTPIRSTQLKGFKLALARVAWAMVTALSLTVGSLAIVRTRPTVPIPELQTIMAGGFDAGSVIAFLLAISITTTLGFWVVAGILVWRRSDDWLALLISAWFIAWGTVISAQFGLPVLAAHSSWRLSTVLLQTLVSTILILVAYLFPGGQFVPGWTRWLAIVLLADVILPVNLLPGTTADVSIWPDFLRHLTAFGLVGSLVFSQVYRYIRVSSPVERQQTRWFVFGFAAMMVLQAVHFALIPAILPRLILTGPAKGWALLADFGVATLSLLLIPIPIGIAILRYRLWGIDVLIRRTLIYGALTGTLSVIYLAFVVLLQRILPAQTPVSIVLTTLLIAALFAPLRRRIQRDIDRRFYRKKYDAERILEEFGSSLRHEVELEKITEALLGVVGETIQPTHVSLWLRPEIRKTTGEPHFTP